MYKKSLPKSREAFNIKVKTDYCLTILLIAVVPSLVMISRMYIPGVKLAVDTLKSEAFTLDTEATATPYAFLTVALTLPEIAELNFTLMLSEKGFGEITVLLESDSLTAVTGPVTVPVRFNV